MTMEYTINIQEVEQLQTIRDLDALEQLFDKARRMVIGGGTVVLVRANGNDAPLRFDEITNEADLAAFRDRVFMYLD